MKASISLVLVMGLTWIIGVLVFNKDLVAVAYIFTIFWAFQVCPTAQLCACTLLQCKQRENLRVASWNYVYSEPTLCFALFFHYFNC